MRYKRQILIILFLFCCSNIVIGIQKESSQQKIKIIAGYKEKLNELIIAKENAEIHYQNILLLADKIVLNTETKDITAEGNVVLQLPEEEISADSLTFNLDSKQGELNNVHGLIQPSIIYEADKLERKDDNLYHFCKLKITSCTQPVPRWLFSCPEANFKKGDYIEMWNPVFSIRKIPVFYFPYIRYPVGLERKTGFLMPQVGYSGTKGAFYVQSFYWNIKRNMDATINVDYYSQRGIGGGLEYRYLFSGGTGGNINLYYFSFKDNPDYEDPDNAYIIRMKHNQTLPFKFNLVADVDYQSSYDFLREFDNNFSRAVVSNRRSQVYLTRAWSHFNFDMRVSRFETYFSQSDRSVIRYNLPQVGFNSSKIKLFSPLYFSFSSSFSSWEKGWDSDYENNTQNHSQSIIFKPVLSIPFTSIPWLTLDSSLSSNLSYYFQSYEPNTNNIVDEPILMHNLATRMEFVGPVFYKIYMDTENNPKLKHIIEPSFVFRYETPVSTGDRIITPGIFYRNHYLQYSLTNRFLIKQNDMPKEILTFSLSQKYYLSPEDSPLKRYIINNEIPEFSDISSLLRFYPSKKYSLDVSLAYNTYYHTFSKLRIGINVGTPADPLFLRVKWFKSVNPYMTNNLFNRHQLNLYGKVKIPKLSLEAQAEVDYNILKKEMLYSAFVFSYNYQCIDISADLRIYFFRATPETQFRLTISLGNIGKTTDFLGGIGFE
ncbi:MAG: LPS-assembly protein LptD [Candidatus Aminicenantaceae bacterium]